MSTETNDDEKSATVIPWPGTRAPTPPAAGTEAKPASESAPVEGAQAAGTPPPSSEEMTIDAFEAAVRRAVQEKLGVDTPQFPPRGADELVAQMLSAISGTDPKAALAEVRERLAKAGRAEPVAAEVIDLSAAREARKRAEQETTSKVGGALRDTFNAFMTNLSASQGNASQITLDAQFLKEHGPSLLGNLFQGLASALLGPAKPPAPPVETPAPAPSGGAPAEGEPGSNAAPTSSAPPTQPEVHIRFDLGSILGGLFKRRAPAPPAATTTTPEPTPPATPENAVAEPTAPEPGPPEPGATPS